MVAWRQTKYARCTDERGFTLPEVLITIVLMGIIAAIATSSWQRVIESRKVDSGTNQFVSDVRLAHTKASNQLTEYRIAFRNEAQVTCAGSAADYCILKKTGASTYEQTPRHFQEDGDRIELHSGGLQADTALATLLGFESGTKSMVFGSDGTSSSGGGLGAGQTDLRVTIRDEDSDPGHVTATNLATSRVKVDP